MTVDNRLDEERQVLRVEVQPILKKTMNAEPDHAKMGLPEPGRT